MAKRVKRIPKKFKPGDRVVCEWHCDDRHFRSVGTIYAFWAWGFANGENPDDGYTPHYQVVWDDHAHKENAHHTDVPQHDLKPLPVIERLAEIGAS